MDLNDLEQIIKIMEQHNLLKVAVKKKDFEVILEKEGQSCVPHVVTAAPAPVKETVPAAAPSAPKEETGSYITSPIVGTFYAAASPDDPPFAKVGDQVNTDTVVCIVEAMKVMNEVKATSSGTITEVLVKNGDPVEFGTKLFRIS